MSSKKLPAIQLYPGDWRKDPGVQALDYEYRGIWFEILLLMHESEQRGKLLLNGKPMPDEALARLLGLDIQKLKKVKSTLLDYGVASTCEETGALINRRMVRDEEIREKRRKAGKKGGNPDLLKQNSSKLKKEDKQTSKQSSTPSYSTSVSYSSSSNKEPPELSDTEKEAKEVAEYLLEAICDNDPTHRYVNNEPLISSWITDIDRAIRLDGREKGKMLKMIEHIFYKKSDVSIFWASNIQSGAKLRKHYDMIKNQLNKKHSRYEESKLDRELRIFEETLE